MSATLPPPYWHKTQHSMLRRNQHNNYHAGHKAYMLTLKIEGMVKLLSTISPAPTFPSAPSPSSPPSPAVTSASPLSSATCCRTVLSPLGEAMRTAWLTLPQRYHNIAIIDSPNEYVIMPEHFHGIIYITGYMQQHLSEIIKLFKARVSMAYRKLMIEGRCHPVGVGIQWLSAYNTLPTETKAATAAWIDRQLNILYSATCCGTQQDPPPFKLSTSGKREKQGFLFATGYTDSLLLDDDNLDGHREYIRLNPYSRLQRTANHSRLSPNRNLVDTAVTISALEGYLRRECPPRDVTDDKLATVRTLLLCSAFPQTSPQSSTPLCSATCCRIACHTYGDRALLQRRLLPIVCHRKDAALFQKQRSRCLQEAASGAIMISACISKGEQEIFKTIQAAGFPVIKIEDNGFPEIYHPSQERIDLCDIGRLLIVTPWQYHYRHKDESIFVAYCKTMNCIAQALSCTKDTWWK